MGSDWGAEFETGTLFGRSFLGFRDVYERVL